MTAEETSSPPPKKGRGGRPKLAPEAKRQGTFGIRFLPAERSEIEKRAAIMGMNPTDFVRSMALDRKLPSAAIPAVNREQYAELGRFASNLNQLVRAVHSGQAVTVSNDVLEETIRELQLLRLALVGVE